MKNRIEILREYIDDVLLRMTDTYERRCAYLHLFRRNGYDLFRNS
jgi:uncharacterized protein